MDIGGSIFESEKQRFLMRYSQQQIREWVRNLSIFRLCWGPRSGQMELADEFVAALGFAGEEELQQIMASLGIELQQLPEDYQPTQFFTTNTSQLSQIPEFPHLAYPQFVNLRGVYTYISVMKNRIELRVFDPESYDLTATAFRQAQQLEASLLLQHQNRVIDPPQDFECYVCPKYYPQYWEEAG